MAKKKGRNMMPGTGSTDKPATLKDRLDPQVLERLKAQANSLKADEAKRAKEERLQREAARKEEQKRLEQDFEYLLSNSKMDWQKYK